MKNNSLQLIVSLVILLFTTELSQAQQFSTARIWNEVVLHGVRNDFARPTVHARNLFHTSIAMYDAFAAYDNNNETYFLGKNIGGFDCPFTGIPSPSNITAARQMAMSFAVYRIVQHRFKDSPGSDEILFNADIIMSALGYDASYVDIDYSSGNPAALGNYIAEMLIEYGLQDGSNEIDEYENQVYTSINPELNPNQRYGDGNDVIVDPNRWQKLEIPNFVDQAGNPTDPPPFLSPEWGEVIPFALSPDDMSIKERDGVDWKVYHDPGPPCYLDTLNGGIDSEEYLWGFSLVANWKTHTILNEDDSIDISPASIGNILEYPQTIAELRDFYKYDEGGVVSAGHNINPHTGEAYEEQWVPKADYTKLVAEWWADGPDSETPPGHWFSILNYVNERPELIKKYKGQGNTMSDLEWDVKSYFVLGGAMHDAAISAWSIKGYYDYIRPISAIRYMLYRGQSSDPSAPRYDIAGIPLIPGKIEQILYGDPFLAVDSSNYGHIKIVNNYFNGLPAYIFGEYWIPYQAPNFVTPPFAGYVSGHSTYSRAAAEVITMLTDDPFFPGGMGEYHFEPGEFQISQGPSRALSLQWATYRDAADQSGLSRIWGGIHPPVDDIPGRLIGEEVGQDAFDKADELFGDAPMTSTEELPKSNKKLIVFPNPVKAGSDLNIFCQDLNLNKSTVQLFNEHGQLIQANKMGQYEPKLSTRNLAAGVYTVKITSNEASLIDKIIVLR